MAGAGYKLFATGDVLTANDVNTYLQQQTVMVFNNAAARTTALSGVVSEGMVSYLKDTNAVEVYDGASWVASDDPNAIQNTIVNAKGDIIGASANDVPAITSVGLNGDTLVADSAATTGLRWQSAYNGNSIINGAMDIWQRGTTHTTTSGVAYTADRWASHTISAGGSVTTSRQTVSDTTNLPTIQYAAKFQRVAGNTNTGILSFFNTLESADSYKFAGQTATLSFYAKKGANYSAASDILVSNVASGTGTDEPLRSFTGLVDRLQNNTLTTTWQRFTQTVSITATATEVGVQFYFTPVGTAGADDSVFITGVQLELGSRATTFKRSNGAGGTIQGELAACQRYYTRFSVADAYHPYCNGQTSSTTNGYVILPLPVTMRIAPTVLDTSAVSTLEIFYESTSKVLSAIAIDRASDKAVPLLCTISAATSGKPVFLRNSNSTSAYIGVSAEL